MPLFTKESLDLLRQRIDLADLLAAHLDLQRAGANFRALCPFHEEKTPSFVLQRGDTHYHCFGCGAHGDAIQFLMTYLNMSFTQAVENLAERFHVPLEYLDRSHEEQGPNKPRLKELLGHASRLFHFFLLHTEEGHTALKYLYQRGIDLEFIRTFQLGLAPVQGGTFLNAMRELKAARDELIACGLMTEQGRAFFHDRITFPVLDPTGAVIGFSARKYREETFGGKYINTSETVLFKKSQLLFGLSYCRRRIAKERRALIVEGQIDALRLIQEGFTYSVAALGTAFGQAHVDILKTLGANRVYLAFDSDEAGQRAAAKVGDLFQKKDIAVYVVNLPKGSDPDSFLREQGPQAFSERVEQSTEYLSWLVTHYSQQIDTRTPSGKSELVKTIAALIREWESPVLIHESLRKLAQLTHVPEELIFTGKEKRFTPPLSAPRGLNALTIDPDRILETDLLRWLLLEAQQRPQLIQLARNNLAPHHFVVKACQQLYAAILAAHDSHEPIDTLSIAGRLDEETQALLGELLRKRINRDRAEKHLVETIQKMLERHWLNAREEIRLKIQSAAHSEEETLQLLKAFDELKRNPPQVAR